MFAVAGLVGSLTHYHSEGLECIDHAEEQHYVQNENLCPICTIVVSGDFNAEISAESLQYEETFISYYSSELPSTTLFHFEPGRAPPFMA